MKKLVILMVLALVPAFSLLAQPRFAHYAGKVDSAPFILIDKQEFKLWLVDADGSTLREWGIACAVNYGPKLRKGDHRTPEGIFKINQLLNAKGLSHDFGDGKGPVKEAYGPWFLRLAVPGFIDIGIHGTPFPESIGSRATEGCIRMRNEDVTELKGLVQVGTPVIILPDPEQAG